LIGFLIGMEEGLKFFALLLAIVALFGLACGRGEIKGTYEIELRIAGAGQPLKGMLMLSTQPLDIPSLSEEDGSIDAEWFGGDALSANSCFILSPQHSSGGAANGNGSPGVVRVFEARIEPNGIRTPIIILRASDLQVEIVKLQFFANALGGELNVQMDQEVRPGRIQGARVGPASSQTCVEGLAAFREFLRNLPSGEDGA
jgi:hypothetical protein